MSSPFDRETFNPFVGRPNGPVPATACKKAPQKTTTLNSAAALAKWAGLVSNRASEEAQLRTLLDKLGRPNAIIIGQIIKSAETGAYGDIINWLTDRKNRYHLPRRFEAVGYVPVYNDARDTGLWRIGRVRQVAYARRDLPLEEQVKAVKALQTRFRLIPTAPDLEPYAH